MIRWVVRLAFITVLLGLAGTVLIVYKMHKKSIKTDVNANNTNALKIDSLQVTTEVNKPKAVDTNATTKPIIAENEPDTIIIQHQETIADGRLQPTRTLPPKKYEITTDKKAITNQTTTPVDPNRLFTTDELERIVNRINKVEEGNKKFANCIRLFITVEGYNAKRVSQVEKYLRSKKFSLEGKEIVAQEIKGVKINGTGRCIKVTLGIF